MRQALTPHPDSLTGGVAELHVEVGRRGAELALRYHLTGDLPGVALPRAGPSARGDELWRHTCFEAFLRSPSAAAYYELNFAPSRQWAAYRLAGYRHGLAPVAIPQPRITVERSAQSFLLDAALDLAGLPDLARGPWRLGLSAVVEAADGQIGYWALAHPPGRPDFHHADCFALELGEPGRP